MLSFKTLRDPCSSIHQSMWTTTKLYIDKGWLSKTLQVLSVDLVTRVRKNRAPTAYSAFDREHKIRA